MMGLVLKGDFQYQAPSEEETTGWIRNACYQELDLVGKISTGRGEQCLCRRVIFVGLRDQRDTGVLVLSLHPIAKLSHHRFKAVIAHLKWVLNDQSVNRSIL